MIVQMGKTSRMVHTLDCEWCISQQYNRGVRMREVDTDTDAKFQHWQTLGMLDLGCEWCSPEIKQGPPPATRELLRAAIPQAEGQVRDALIARLEHEYGERWAG